MTNATTGPAALLRGATAAMGLLLAMGLAACTTVEGTNALADIGTFEREVMTSTAVGVGLLPPPEGKADPTARAPLALPRDMAALPPPTRSASAQLPADSANPQIDASGLSQADLQRLRNARVVDLRSLSGRPLTEAEARALTARMTAAGMNVSASNQRPLYLPPDHYYTVVGGRDLVCQAPDGQLVPLADQRCPEAIRRAISAASPQVQSGGALGTRQETWSEQARR